MKIKNQLADIRKFKNYTQKELAEKLNISISTIQNYENGRRKLTLDILKMFSEALDVKLDVFINGLDIPVYTFLDIAKIWDSVHMNLQLNEFLDYPENDKDYLFFISSMNYDAKLYKLVSDELRLSDKELNNWALSSRLLELINSKETSSVKIYYEIDDIKTLIDLDLLFPQETDDLLNNGLSEENQNIIINYLIVKERVVDIKNNNIVNFDYPIIKAQNEPKFLLNTILGYMTNTEEEYFLKYHVNTTDNNFEDKNVLNDYEVIEIVQNTIEFMKYQLYRVDEKRTKSK